MPPAIMHTFRVSKINGGSANQIDQQNMVFPAIKDFVDFFAEDPSRARYIKKVINLES